MDTILSVVGNPVFWGVVATVAAFIPGPQTKLISVVAKGIAGYLKKKK